MTTAPEMWSLEWWKIVFELIQAFFVSVAAVATCIGVTQWWRQTVGKRKIELAEEVLTGFYESRDVFRWVRSRGILGGEGEGRKVSEPEEPEVKRLRDLYSIPLERLAREKELFAKLLARRYPFIALFGDDLAVPFATLNDVHGRIVVAASILMDAAPIEAAAQIGIGRPTDSSAMRNDLGWGPATRPDDIDLAIDAAVEKIESVCKPVLKSRWAV